VRAKVITESMLPEAAAVENPLKSLPVPRAAEQ
jgi:hypothetical protein